MKISLSWLQDYLSGPVSAQDVAKKLTEQGVEVEAIEEIGQGISNVVAAEITAARPHPEADKLSLCTVSDGTNTFEVVCGAKNWKVGDKVPFAREGATLPGGLTITARKLRGVESRGMLCSEKELGLSEEASGLWILPPDTPLGLDIAAAVRDTVLVLGVTPNRPDCLSHVGVAREVAAALGLTLKLPSPKLKEGPPLGDLARVTILDPEGCPRYAARVIRGVSVRPSPLWMQRRLLAVGVRAISNIVDVTNYVLMELGHPLHAFDLDKLAGKEIRVRKANPGEKTQTLDGVERTLSEEDVVIADAEKTVAIAGVMGGATSEVSDETKDVLLESAYFSPTRVRRTSKRHGLHTEASHRFERGADPNAVILAQDRALELFSRYAGGEILSGRHDVYPNPILPKRISLRPARVRQILGVDAPVEPLTRLGLRKVESGQESDTWEIPTFRPDLEREIDLIEEVARLYGMDAIPARLPRMAATAQPAEELLSPFASLQSLRQAARQAGLLEAVSYGFISRADLGKLPLPEGDLRSRPIPLVNPIASDLDVMRPTLLVGLLAATAHNQKRQQRDIRLFELGKVFLTQDEGVAPREELRLAAVLSGEEGGWWGQRPTDFYDLKGIAEILIEALGYSAPALRPLSEEKAPYFIPGAAGEIFLGEEPLGELGELHPDLLERFDVSGRVFYLDLSVDALLKIPRPEHRFQELSRFPAVTRDLALLFDRSVTWGQISQEISRARAGAKAGILHTFRLFDLYEGKNIPEGKRSFAISLTFQSKERTLTEEEVQSAQDAIVNALTENLGARIR